MTASRCTLPVSAAARRSHAALVSASTSASAPASRFPPPALHLWLFWILLGLIAGSLAKFLVPGRDPAGCIFTILLGCVGAILGGLIGTWIGWGKIDQGTLDLRSIAIATFGAIILLLIGRLVRRKR